MPFDPTELLIGSGINLGKDIIEGLIREGRMKEARKYIEGMNIPTADKMSYKAVLALPPEQALTIIQKDTRLGNIEQDPRLKSAQMDALTQLQNRGREGYTIEDKAAIDQSMNQALTQQRGANLAQQSQMQRRGISGSGIDLAQQLARQQGGVTAASQAGLQQAANSRRQALSAMQSAGQLGGQIRGQEWGQKAQTASAQDAINNANARNQMTTQQFNINQQQRVNLANQQAEQDAARSVANANKAEADLRNKKAMSMAGTYA